MKYLSAILSIIGIGCFFTFIILLIANAQWASLIVAVVAYVLFFITAKIESRL